MLLAKKKKKQKLTPAPIPTPSPRFTNNRVWESITEPLYSNSPLYGAKIQSNARGCGGGGGGGGVRSCRQRSFLSEFDNLPIFVCFLSIPSYAGEIFDHDYLDL